MPHAFSACCVWGLWNKPPPPPAGRFAPGLEPGCGVPPEPAPGRAVGTEMPAAFRHLSTLDLSAPLTPDEGAAEWVGVAWAPVEVGLDEPPHAAASPATSPTVATIVPARVREVSTMDLPVLSRRLIARSRRICPVMPASTFGLRTD